MSVEPGVTNLLQLSTIHSELLKRQDQWLAAHGISFKEFLVLHWLDQAPTGRMKRVDLAGKVALSASGVTRLLNPLQKIGLVDKEEGARDARVSLVRLTPAGETMYRDAAASFSERAKSWLKSLSEPQRKALAALAEAFPAA